MIITVWRVKGRKKRREDAADAKQPQPRRQATRGADRIKAAVEKLLQ